MQIPEKGTRVKTDRGQMIAICGSADSIPVEVLYERSRTRAYLMPVPGDEAATRLIEEVSREVMLTDENGEECCAILPFDELTLPDGTRAVITDAALGSWHEGYAWLYAPALRNMYTGEKTIAPFRMLASLAGAMDVMMNRYGLYQMFGDGHQLYLDPENGKCAILPDGTDLYVKKDGQEEAAAVPQDVESRCAEAFSAMLLYELTGAWPAGAGVTPEGTTRDGEPMLDFSGVGPGTPDPSGDASAREVWDALPQEIKAAFCLAFAGQGGGDKDGTPAGPQGQADQASGDGNQGGVSAAAQRQTEAASGDRDKDGTPTGPQGQAGAVPGDGDKGGMSAAVQGQTGAVPGDGDKGGMSAAVQGQTGAVPGDGDKRAGAAGVMPGEWARLFEEAAALAQECPHCGRLIPQGGSVCLFCGKETKKGNLLVRFAVEDGNGKLSYRLAFGRGKDIFGCSVWETFPRSPLLRAVYNAKRDILGIRNLSKADWLAAAEDGSEREIHPGDTVPVAPGLVITFSLNPVVRMRFLGYEA